MSIAAAHASAFYREIAITSVIWTIKDGGGYPAPLNADGKRSMPFWSSELRAVKVVSEVAAYKNFEVVAIDWVIFCERWVPGLIFAHILNSNPPIIRLRLISEKESLLSALQSFIRS